MRMTKAMSGSALDLGASTAVAAVISTILVITGQLGTFRLWNEYN